MNYLMKRGRSAAQQLGQIGAIRVTSRRSYWPESSTTDFIYAEYCPPIQGRLIFPRRKRRKNFRNAAGLSPYISRVSRETHWIHQRKPDATTIETLWTPHGREWRSTSRWTSRLTPSRDCEPNFHQLGYVSRWRRSLNSSMWWWHLQPTTGRHLVDSERDLLDHFELHIAHDNVKESCPILPDKWWFMSVWISVNHYLSATKYWQWFRQQK